MDLRFGISNEPVAIGVHVSTHFHRRRIVITLTAHTFTELIYSCLDHLGCQIGLEIGCDCY